MVSRGRGWIALSLLVGSQPEKLPVTLIKRKEPLGCGPNWPSDLCAYSSWPQTQTCSSSLFLLGPLHLGAPSFLSSQALLSSTLCCDSPCCRWPGALATVCPVGKLGTSCCGSHPEGLLSLPGLSSGFGPRGLLTDW